MKLLKKFFFTLTVLFALFAMVSCLRTDVSGTNEKYTLTLDYGDGRESEKITFHQGETVTIKKPERDGYDFVGWCTDKELTNFADLERSINGDVTLYAKWTFDYKSLLDLVSGEASEKCVKIVSRDGIYTSNQGSGVIYKSDAYYCYVLTNSHVVTDDNGNVSRYNKVYDVYGNEYNATVLKNDPSCDLAVLKFRGAEPWTFENLEIEDRIPKKGEEIITVSAPGGKYNTVTLGDVMWYGKVETDTKIDFEVLWIEGETDHGSSGGAVLDGDMNIVGILYAVLTGENGDVRYALAIPTSKIVEFLADIQYDG